MTKKWIAAAIKTKLTDSRSLFKKVNQPGRGDMRSLAARQSALQSETIKKRQGNRRRKRKDNVSELLIVHRAV